MSDENPSRLIDEKLAAMGDWRGAKLSRLRGLIKDADPDVVEEVKWRKPSNPSGVPTWSHAGIICTGETYKDKVKLTFASGAALADPSGLFNSSLEGGTRRAIDFREGDEAYTIRFTPRRKGGIWSKVSVERFDALKADGQMTSAGKAAYERDKHRSGLYSYEKPMASLTPDEETVFRRNKPAWSDWEKRPPGYRRSALGWITSAKRPETRAKRLAELIAVSSEGRRLPQYDWQKKP